MKDKTPIPESEDVVVLGEMDIPMPEETTVLLPCPRCRNKQPKLHAAVGPNKKRWYVKCSDKKCGAHLKYCFLTGDEAINHWNAIKRGK